MSSKDTLWISICASFAAESKCLSRKIGAVIVKDNILLTAGYNGPPRKIMRCNDRYNGRICNNKLYHRSDECPRGFYGYMSGEALELCPAAHAEANAITNYARMGGGVGLVGSTLYLNTVIPCKNCAALIINAGIIEIVCAKLIAYDNLGLALLEEAGVKMREYK